MLCKAKGIEPADAGAGILRVFEQWTNSKFGKDEAETERARQYASQGVAYEPEDLWIWLPQDTLKRHELFDIFGERSVASALKKIVELGYLETRRNPKYGWDRTLQYRLNITGLQAALDGLQNCSLALPQSAVIEVANRGDGRPQSATSNTKVTSNESSQDKERVAPKIPATARPSKLTNEQRQRLQADGAAIAERVAAMERVSPDDFTSSADGMTNADVRPQPFEALKDEITAVWGWDNGGLVTNMAKMLAGKRGKGEYDTYKFDSQPVTADELEAWAVWVKQTYPNRDMVTTCESIAKSVGEYRATGQKSTGVQNPIILAPEPETPATPEQLAEQLASLRRMKAAHNG